MKIIKLSAVILAFFSLVYFTGYFLNTYFVNRLGVFFKPTNIAFQPLPKVEGFLSWGAMQNARIELSVRELIPNQIYARASWLGLNLSGTATQVGGSIEIKGNYQWELPKILRAQLNVPGMWLDGEFHLATAENSLFGVLKVKDFQAMGYQTDAVRLTGECHIRSSMVDVSGVFYCDLSRSQKVAGVWRSKELETFLLVKPETIRFVAKFAPTLEDLKSESGLLRIKIFKSASGSVELDYAGVNNSSFEPQAVN